MIYIYGVRLDHDDLYDNFQQRNHGLAIEFSEQMVLIEYTHSIPVHLQPRGPLCVLRVMCTVPLDKAWLERLQPASGDACVELVTATKDEQVVNGGNFR